MVRERYNPSDNQWMSYSDFDANVVSEAIYQQVGARFPITWEGDEVIVDFDELPPGVSENDIKQAVRDNHPHR